MKKGIHKMQAIKYLEKHLVEGTCNQIDDVNKYLEGFDLEQTLVGETSKNGNEVFIFQDGSVLVRIEDEAFEYKDLEDY